MEISEKLLCLFSGQIEERDGSYFVEVPKHELRLGEIEDGEVYRVGLVSSTAGSENKGTGTEERKRKLGSPEPPVEEGEQRIVEIEDMGDQGDGITRVERGYVVIVPDTEKGERVSIKIIDVQENVAFAEVVERLDYYE